MFASLICGSFHEQDLQDDGTLSCGFSPRSIKKSRAKSRSFVRRCSRDEGHGKNPYSTVGLDKFSALMSDLEEKKKNIYLQRDSRDILFVRFVYSGSEEEVVPVIVKSKGMTQKQGVVSHKGDELRSGNDVNKQAAVERAKEGLVMETNDEKIVTGQKKRMTWEMNKKKLGRPCYYVPIFAVLILLLLATFGRSFAILCTAIGWYLVPTLTGMTVETTTSSSSSSSSCGSMKKTPTTGAARRATSPRGK